MILKSFRSIRYFATILLTITSEKSHKTVVYVFFKLRLGASIPRSVGLSVCLSVGLSVLQKLQKITKLYKTLQNIVKHQKSGFAPPRPLFVL